MTLELRAERQTGKRKKSLPLTSQRLPEIINEIGMGRYHLITFVILVFTPLAEGAGMIVMTNITHALKHEFHFSNWQAGSLDAFSFSGLAIGHYVAGFLADLKGRRLPIVLGYLGISLVGLFMTLASGYKSMVLLRIFHGIACGVGVPPAMSMIAEIMPSDWRPFMFIIFWSFTAVGETYAALGLIIFMPSLTESTSWKQAVLWSALPAFLMLLSSLARLQESAHWLAVRGHLVEARIVLEQMARMNQKLDVLKKLGTLPACSHDLSILYNVAGINSRGQHLGQGKAFEHASPAEIIRILLQPNILKMVALFSVLASTGNIETFGLSNVWPELLRHEAHGGLHEAVGPAVKLMFIVSVGIPVGVLCALISLSNAASHKIYIMIAGFLGCVGLTCILVFEHSSALLLTSMLITHMSGTLEYSVAMIWCEESFPTKVRASATGVVIFFGTLWSVTSPLLLTAVGEKGFILIAGVAFAMAPLAALPLQETHGAELQDFADEEDEEEDEIEEEDEDEIESSAPRRDGIQLSWAFSNGTIGAAMELSMIAGLLGAVPGVSFTSFYSSMGFIIHQSKDRSFFTKEMLLGNGIAVATHLFLRREEVEVEISVPFQKRLVSIFRRLVLSSLFLAVVNFFMAFCESEMSMLTLGSVQSFFNAILLNTSHALTKPLNRNGSVQLGFLSGALLPILTIPFTGFGPKSSLLSRLAFYLVPSSFCFLIGLLIWAYHRRVAMHLETAQTDDADADAPRNIADLAEAYKNFKVRRNTTGQADQMQTKHFFLAFPAVLCYQMFSYFFAGLFPVLADETGTKTSPLSLYLLMICGDMLGSFIAFIWTSFCEPMELAAAGAAGGGALQICFMALFLLSLLSTTTALFPSVCATHTTSVPLGHSVEPSVIFLVFFFGSFSKAGLEALCPPVLRARLAGVLIGLTAVLLCYEIGTFSKTTEKGRY